MTEIVKPTWNVDGWTGNTIDADGTWWLVHQDDGWFSPAPVRGADEDKPDRHGTYSAPNLRGPRVITLTGIAKAPTAATAAVARDTFAALLADGQLHWLTVGEPTQQRSAWVKLGVDPKLSNTSPVAFNFQLILVAPDPRKLSADPLSASTLLATPAVGGVQWGGPDGTTGVAWGGPDGSTGVQYGTSGSGGQLVLDNTAGTAPADILFTVTGPVLAPRLTRVDTGEVIAYGADLADSDVLSIDTGTGAVRLGGIQRRPYLSSADFFPIPPRESIVVAYSGDTSNSQSIATAEWHTTTW